MDLKINPRKVRPSFMGYGRLVLPRAYFGTELPDYEEIKRHILKRGYRRYWADLTITATSVLPGTGSTYDGKKIAGETVTAGQPLYYDSTTLKFLKAINTVALSGTGMQTWNVLGIAISGGAINQPLHLQNGGQITIGATVVIATEYYLSANAGGICPLADVASGHQVIRLGYADTVSTLQLDIKNLGVKP